MGEDLALSKFPRVQLISDAFDKAHDMIDQIDEPHGDTQAEREEQATKVQEAAKAANKALMRAKNRCLFSQYEVPRCNFC